MFLIKIIVLSNFEKIELVNIVSYHEVIMIDSLDSLYKSFFTIMKLFLDVILLDYHFRVLKFNNYKTVSSVYVIYQKLPFLKKR